MRIALRSLNFNHHFKSIRQKCFERLKLIKILANKKWNLKTDIHITIYKSLIQSIFYYSSIIHNQINTGLKEYLTVVQYNAIRTIFKLHYSTHRTTLVEIGMNNNLVPIELRSKQLNVNYFLNAINVSNPLIVKLIYEYKNGIYSRSIKKTTPLCEVWNEIKENIH